MKNFSRNFLSKCKSFKPKYYSTQVVVEVDEEEERQRILNERVNTVSESFVPGPVEHGVGTSYISSPCQTTQLDNGFRVVTEPRVGETAAVGVFIGAGSRHETEANNGVAHFLEHMYFKGTQRRSANDLEVEFENHGAAMNAHTSREYTGYTSNCLANDVSRSVDALADVLNNSKFDQQAIDLERGTILREYEEVNQSIDEVLFDKMHELAFQGNPLSYTILGSEENIANITREQMIDFRKENYTGDRMVLVGCGNVDHDELVKLADKNFSQIAPTPVNAEPTSPVPFTGGDIRFETDSTPLLHLGTAFEGPALDSPDSLVIGLIQILIGNYDQSMGAGKYVSSPVVRSLASRDLCMSLTPFNHAYSDTSLFGFHSISNPTDAPELQYTLISGLTRMCFTVRAEQLERAKRLFISQILVHYSNGLDEVLDELGRQVLFFNRRVSLAEFISRINQITSDDVKRVAEKYIYDQDPVISALGSTEEIQDYNWSRSWTTMWRQ